MIRQTGHQCGIQPFRLPGLQQFGTERVCPQGCDVADKGVCGGQTAAGIDRRIQGVATKSTAHTVTMLAILPQFDHAFADAGYSFHADSRILNKAVSKRKAKTLLEG